MVTANGTISLKTSARDEIIDITGKVQEIVTKAGIRDGLACDFVVGSTAGVTTVEYEPGLVKDLQKAMDRLYPKDVDYEHQRRWADGNGHSHVRASFVGPSLTVPVSSAQLELGTWQQIVFMEFDNKPRSREVMVKVLGDR